MSLREQALYCIILSHCKLTTYTYLKACAIFCKNFLNCAGISTSGTSRGWRGTIFLQDTEVGRRLMRPHRKSVSDCIKRDRLLSPLSRTVRICFFVELVNATDSLVWNTIPKNVKDFKRTLIKKLLHYSRGAKLSVNFRSAQFFLVAHTYKLCNTNRPSRSTWHRC